MDSFSMAPLLRQSIGFDRFNDLFESVLHNEGANAYPPYNVEKFGDHHYRITVAVAGFVESELKISVDQGVLILTGSHEERISDDKTTKKVQGDQKGPTYLHQGIAQQSFRLSFRLADHVEVLNAHLEHGMLRIDLERNVPEAVKPRHIPIASEDTTH